jgi:hypothetical protein
MDWWSSAQWAKALTTNVEPDVQVGDGPLECWGHEHVWLVPGPPRPARFLFRRRYVIACVNHSVGELGRLCFSCANSDRLVLTMLPSSEFGDAWWLRNFLVMCINCRCIGIYMIDDSDVQLNPSPWSSDLWHWREKFIIYLFGTWAFWYACMYLCPLTLWLATAFCTLFLHEKINPDGLASRKRYLSKIFFWIVHPHDHIQHASMSSTSHPLYMRVCCHPHIFIQGAWVT